MKTYGTVSPELPWRRPSYCASGECAEIAKLDGRIALRSSTAPDTFVSYTPEEWKALVKAIKQGEFDLELARAMLTSRSRGTCA
jgi:hypothetical protein